MLKKVFPLLTSILSLSILLAIGCGGGRSASSGAVVTSPLAGETVSATANPLVAVYSATPQQVGTLAVEFGTDQTYGRSTSPQAAAVAGSPFTVLIAGLQQKTLYHLRATLTTSGNEKLVGSDQVFTTGSIPGGLLPAVTTTTAAGSTPQPGIEMIDAVLQYQRPFATDLAGNVIWYYAFPDAQPASVLYAIRLLPNGHLASMIAPASQTIATNPATPVPAGSLVVLREFDLAGNTIQQLTMADLNTRMAAAGFNVKLQLFSHDFQMLPNGHWLIIANTVQSFANLVGYPGSTDVTGDVVVDLDSNLNPVWYWNEFDYFDVNRHPMNFPDWTHTNAITYSVDDGNFIVSIRHQNWIVKVDYQNGAGTGNVLWKLGEGGDFQLLNGVDPPDWFYAQHNSVFTGPNTAGTFNLALMDNGNDREFPPAVQCGTSGAPPCLYTTIPVMQINERAMTASFLFHQVLPANLYNSFAGNTAVLDNTDVEYDVNGSSPGASVYEVTQQSSPATVWQMNILGSYDYRAFRMPSLYPGVQW